MEHISLRICVDTDIVLGTAVGRGKLASLGAIVGPPCQDKSIDINFPQPVSRIKLFDSQQYALVSLMASKNMGSMILNKGNILGIF